MSPNTKQVLAITFGVLGMLLGALGTVTAYNAKNATDTESEVSAQVQQQFAEAQQKQDELEATRASDAEKLVNSLSSAEKNLVKKINGNSKGIKQLRRRYDNLNSRDKQLANELSTLENEQQDDFDTLNQRINNLNKQITKIERNINRLRTRVGLDEAFAE